MAIEQQMVDCIHQLAECMEVNVPFKIEHFDSLNDQPTLSIMVEHEENSIHPLIKQLVELGLEENMSAGVLFSCQINMIVCQASLEKLSNHIATQAIQAQKHTIIREQIPQTFWQVNAADEPQSNSRLSHSLPISL